MPSSYRKKKRVVRSLIFSLITKFPIIKRDKDYILFQVANHETLAFSLYPYQSQANYTLELIKYHYHDSKEKLKICLFGGIKGEIKKNVEDQVFQRFVNSLKFYQQNVNPQLMLFGCSSEEKYIKGELKDWDRIKNRIISKANLKELGKRSIEWRKKHPLQDKATLREYDIKECKKARCIYYDSTKKECKFGLLPSNFKKEAKLRGGTGYCFQYRNAKMLKIQERLTQFAFRLLFEKYDYFSTRRRLISTLKQLTIPPQDFFQVNPFFSRKKFRQLILLLNEKLGKNQQSFLEGYTEKIQVEKTRFKELLTTFTLFKEAFVKDLAYKKKFKEFQSFHEEIKNDRESEVSRLDSLIRDITKRNQLIDNLFRKEKHDLDSKLEREELEEGMFIYFLKSKEREITIFRGRRTEYYNIGRVQVQDDQWEDYHLAPKWYDNGRHPIFEVIENDKKSYTLIQETFSKKEIRLIKNRRYEAIQIKFGKIIQDQDQDQDQDQVKINTVLILIFLSYLRIQSHKNNIVDFLIT